ncbi:tetratricopeptide repeat protein [Streptomyces sp. J2-1]|uniref:tetratricopeptide repeat protein n=1 Tax=Streptomyces corallincola TaxID=2851888 RepID=UPI001C38CD3E|nr:tetratricopeptide repeat protein [Streptomyces corallincola]MBV2354385.1 tetratricopeptide repeat protein [Streptomyces corallincola]
MGPPSPTPSPTPSPVPGPPRRRGRRRLLIAAGAVCVAAGTVLVLLPAAPERTPARPSAGAQAQARARAEARAQARALTAVTSGVPAAPPALATLIARQESAVRARPGDVAAWAVLGSAYLERGRHTVDAADFPRAERALRTALEAAGPAGDAVALDAMTALAVARRDFPTARSFGEQAVKRDPGRWQAYPALIDAYTGLGDYKAARGALDRLMALKVNAAARPAVMARAAAVYRDRGWREDAVAQLTDAAAAARTPAEQAAYLTRTGQLAWERGEREDALRHFEAALRLDPDEPAALTGRARVLAALDRPDEAVAAYQTALARQPDPYATLELGELYEALGQSDAARTQYELLLERTRRTVAGGVDEELLIGRYEADHGDPEEAVERLRAEWQRQPGIEVADALGWALHRAGDDEEALTFAETATDSTKGGGVRSALYAFHRGMIERELDDYAPARRDLEDALRVNPYFSPLRAPEAREALRGLDALPEKPPPADFL